MIFRSHKLRAILNQFSVNNLLLLPYVWGNSVASQRNPHLILRILIPITLLVVLGWLMLLLTRSFPRLDSNFLIIWNLLNLIYQFLPSEWFFIMLFERLRVCGALVIRRYCTYLQVVLVGQSYRIWSVWGSLATFSVSVNFVVLSLNIANFICFVNFVNVTTSVLKRSFVWLFGFVIWISLFWHGLVFGVLLFGVSKSVKLGRHS